MRNFIAPHHIANQVRMTASDHKGAFLLVEGDTDARVYEGFIDKATCKVVVGHSKGNVLQAVELLLKTGPQGIAAIVDSDYWLLQAITPPRDCIFTTDSHDLETMMLQTEAFYKVLRELASRQKLAQFEKASNTTIIDALVATGLPIGFARWISERESLALKFRDIDFTTFVDTKSLAISLSQLVNAIVSNTANPSISSKDLQDKVSQEQKSTHLDVWHICAGHDLMNILSIGLQKAIGNRKPNEVARDVLERHFRLAYEYEFFQTSQLWKSLRIWEAKHPAYKLFRD